MKRAAPLLTDFSFFGPTALQTAALEQLNTWFQFIASDKWKMPIEPTWDLTYALLDRFPHEIGPTDTEPREEAFEILCYIYGREPSLSIDMYKRIKRKCSAYDKWSKEIPDFAEMPCMLNAANVCIHCHASAPTMTREG